MPSLPSIASEDFYKKNCMDANSENQSTPHNFYFCRKANFTFKKEEIIKTKKTNDIHKFEEAKGRRCIKVYSRILFIYIN